MKLADILEEIREVGREAYRTVEEGQRTADQAPDGLALSTLLEERDHCVRLAV